MIQTLKTRNQISYHTSSGKRLNLSSAGLVYLPDHNLFSWTWNVNSIPRYDGWGDHIISQHIESKYFKMKIQVYAKNRAEFYGALDRLTVQFAEDMAKNKLGRLYCNGWFLNCQISGCRYEKFNLIDKAEVDLEFLAGDPIWRREQSFEWRSDPKTGDSLDGKKYAYKYAYRYGSPNITVLSVRSALPSDVIIYVYGPAEHPKIQIGKNEYIIQGVIHENETAVIDTENRTLNLVLPTGEKRNWFNLRDRSKDIFSKIESGDQEITRSGSFNAKIIVLERQLMPLIGKR